MAFVSPRLVMEVSEPSYIESVWNFGNVKLFLWFIGIVYAIV